MALLAFRLEEFVRELQSFCDSLCFLADVDFIDGEPRHAGRIHIENPRFLKQKLREPSLTAEKYFVRTFKEQWRSMHESQVRMLAMLDPNTGLDETYPRSRIIRGFIDRLDLPRDIREALHCVAVEIVLIPGKCPSPRLGIKPKREVLNQCDGVTLVVAQELQTESKITSSLAKVADLQAFGEPPSFRLVRDQHEFQTIVYALGRITWEETQQTNSPSLNNISLDSIDDDLGNLRCFLIEIDFHSKDYRPTLHPDVGLTIRTPQFMYWSSFDPKNRGASSRIQTEREDPTYFDQSTLGIRLMRALFELKRGVATKAGTISQETTQDVLIEKPLWDPNEWKLSYRGETVCFDPKGDKYQFVFNEFQDRGWPRAIENPFPENRREDLHNIAKKLRRRLKGLIRIECWGGNGFRWEAVEVAPNPSVGPH